MVQQIVLDFRSTVNFSSDGEVSLFQKLASSITNNSKSIFIDQTHGGQVSTVYFTNVHGKPDGCEIADLLIMIYDGNSNLIRVTFWQAKKDRSSAWLKVANQTGHLDFDAQFNQWDLLSRRPDVKAKPGLRFCPPSRILSSFVSPSVGSFGIFYERGGQIEITHSTASFISCDDPSKVAGKTKLMVNGAVEGFFLYGSEAIARSSLSGFLEALFAFQIGALIDPRQTEHSWLISYARSLVKQNPHFKAILDNISPPGDLDNVNMLNAGVSLLFIDLSSGTSDE